MPLRIQVICARHVEEGTPGQAYTISIDGTGGLLDLCPQCQTELLDPILDLLQAWGRTNQQGNMTADYSEGANTAWPNSKINTNALAKNGHPVGRRAHNGGARPNSGPTKQPAHDVDLGFAFRCLEPSCPHSVGSDSGIEVHMNVHHPHIKPPAALKLVALCGLCEPPFELPQSVSAKGVHARAAHQAALGQKVHRGAFMALVGAVRRQGDPHGTLRAMDHYLATKRGGDPPNPQLRLGDPADDHETEDQPTS